MLGATVQAVVFNQLAKHHMSLQTREVKSDLLTAQSVELDDCIGTVKNLMRLFAYMELLALVLVADWIGFVSWDASKLLPVWGAE